MMKFLKVAVVLLILTVSGYLSFVLFRKLINDANIEETPTDEVSDSGTQEEIEDISVILSLDSVSRAFLGDSGEINIVIDPMYYEIPGVDLVVSYDNEMIQIDSIQDGTSFSDYLVKEIDSDNGLITISAIAPLENLINSKSIIGTLKFTALKEGNTTLSFVQGEIDSPDTYVSLADEYATQAPLKIENLDMNIIKEPTQEDLDSMHRLLEETE